MAPADEVELAQYRRDYPALIESHHRLRRDLESADRFGQIATLAAFAFFILLVLKDLDLLP